LTTPTDDQPGPVHVSVPLAEAMERLAARVGAARPSGLPQDDAGTLPTPVLTTSRVGPLAGLLEAS
jgi:hypothetical protein